MKFQSSNPPLSFPNLTIWDWLFGQDSKFSQVDQRPSNETRGFTNTASKERVDFMQAKQFATWLSIALKSHGLGVGDCVAVFSPNSVWYPVSMLAIGRAGGIMASGSPAYSVEEMIHVLRVAQVKFLIAAPACIKTATQAAQAVGLPRDHVFLLEGKSDDRLAVPQLIEKGKHLGKIEDEAFGVPKGKTNAEICAFLCFSSGTTGLPKAVMVSHRNVIAQCLQVGQITPLDYRKVLAALPVYHITGLIHQLHLPIFLNAEVYLLPHFTMEKMLATIVDYQIIDLLLVPPIIIRLVRDPIVEKYGLSHVKRFFSGAAPLSREILGLLEKKFPGTGFRQAYGMTESCSAITMHPLNVYAFRYARYGGAIVADTEIKIIDPDNAARELGYEQPGEILARGPQVAMGYFNNPKATRETFDDEGWLHMGDIGTINREGFITITDRLKEVIKVKGVAVAPAELEDLLLGHPAVEDVAVISILDQGSGERPKAYVVPNPAALVNDRERVRDIASELFGFVKKKRVREKWIAEIEFVEAIPKSASGKILRKVLRGAEKNRDEYHQRIVFKDVSKPLAKI